jgi:hypothetical protein
MAHLVEGALDGHARLADATRNALEGRLGGALDLGRLHRQDRRLGEAECDHVEREHQVDVGAQGFREIESEFERARRCIAEVVSMPLLGGDPCAPSRSASVVGVAHALEAGVHRGDPTVLFHALAQGAPTAVKADVQVRHRNAERGRHRGWVLFVEIYAAHDFRIGRTQLSEEPNGAATSRSSWLLVRGFRLALR